MIFSAIIFLSGGTGIINPRSPSFNKSLQPPTSVLNIGTSLLIASSTEVGGCKDLLNDGERGFIIPIPPDKKIIAENIIYIINNQDEATKRADAAKEFISKEYSFLVQANQYMKIFQKNKKIEL